MCKIVAIKGVKKGKKAAMRARAWLGCRRPEEWNTRRNVQV